MLLLDQLQPAIIRQSLIMDMAGLIITDTEVIIMVITDGNNVNDIYMVNFFESCYTVIYNDFFVALYSAARLAACQRFLSFITLQRQQF